VTDTTATITWTTDEPSTSVINYGESTPYTDTDASDTTLVTDHSVTLSGLTADTDYHFEIVSTDVSSNSGASADQLFTTGITINNGWWNNNWNYRASITVNSGNYARSEKPVEVIINFTSYLDAIDQTTAFDENSIRVHEVDVNGNIIAQNISFQFDSATDFDATTNAQGTLVFLLSGNTASQTDRYFQVYFDVEGGGYTPSTFTSQVNVTNDVSDEGQNSFQINSGNANYFYQKQGAGFSSIVDNNGNDWISYHQEVSGESGAANQFRGLPNLVSPANGGDFHPGATSALSVLMHEGPLKATIESITTDGLWKVQWEFFPNFARMTVNLAAENYWFLYEGTPGGTLDLADFMMRSDETQNLVDASWTSDISDPEWVYFSDPNVGNGRSLFLAHHTDDSAIDSYSPLDSATDLQMTVFGFGRDGMNSFIDKNQTHQFTIGLTDSTDFAGTSATIESAYRTINATITSSDQNPGVGGSNTAPTVEAGDDQTIALSVDATLDGTVSDDGLPTTPGTVTTLWTLISGPTGGTVLFADATQVDTTANFSVEGTYVLDLDADDSELANNDQITITVNAGGADTTAPTIVGAISTTVTETTAILTWVTDELTTSTVNYGENIPYSEIDNTDNVLATNHSITLSNLTPETEYHFEVISSDGADNSATSADQSFTTSTQ
ncbi:MAG: fibronectin type III domain-containing protein, partial [Cocleimonas sp.]